MPEQRDMRRESEPTTPSVLQLARGEEIASSDSTPHAWHHDTSSVHLLHRMTSQLRQTVHAPRSVLFMHVLLWVIVATSSIVHIAIIGASRGAQFDIVSYQLQAATVFHHQNVYTAPGLEARYPYPPVWIWIAAGMQMLSQVLHIRFDEAIKIPALVGDLALIWAMYAYARDRVGTRIVAIIPALIFAFSPITWLISAAHGQFDSLVLLFLCLAFVVRGVDGERNILWSAFLLGVAIALKGYPILALPYFVLTAPVGKRIISCMVSFAPLILCTALYSALFGFSLNMPKYILGYKSWPHFGWEVYLSAMLGRSLLNNQTLIASSEIFIIAFAVFVPIRFFRHRPAFAIALIFLTFNATTFAMSVQYLLWALPFVCLVAPVAAVIYIVVATVAALSFYIQVTPDALPTLPLWWDIARALSVFRVASVVGIILVSGYIALYILLKETSLGAILKRQKSPQATGAGAGGE